MNEEEKDIKLEELFRSKLEGSEIEPGADLEGRFMSRLGRREFLRFNAGRFNIFYLASITAAAAVSGIILFSQPRQPEAINEKETTVPVVESQEPYEIPKTTVNAVKAAEGDNTQVEKEGKTVKTTSRTQAAHFSDRKNEIVSSSGIKNEKVRLVRENRAEDQPLSEAGMPKAIIEVTAESGCLPLHVHFSSLSSGVSGCEWNFGDGGTSTENEVDYIYDIAGNYTVSLTVTDQGGHKAIASIDIEVWPKPKALFEIPESEIATSDDRISLTNLSSGAVQYLWSFGDGRESEAFEPTHMYDHYGKYDVTLRAYSDKGCVDSVTLADVFTDMGVYLRFPNAFTPSTGGPTGGYYTQRSDEANQVFHPVSSGVTVYSLKIYSKQGMLVFESDDLNMGWDGYYKGQLCSPGIYIWKVRGRYRNGQPIVMSGDVTLLNY